MDFIQNNALLIAVAVVSGVMLLWPLLRRGTGGSWVSPAQATQMINREDALPVDVRDAGEFSTGHMLGAKSVPLARISEGAPELAKRKDRPLIVYCDGDARATKASAALKKQGFTRVTTLTGGLGAWQQAGLPVEK